MSERERFEAWAAKPPREWWTARADENHKYLLEGEYLDEGVQRAWEAWQAACPEGWLCVPVEPTDEMEEAALDAHMPFGDMKLAIQVAIVHAPKPGDV